MRLNILISAFACQPGKGSEPGVGWNFVKHMAGHHNVWALTKSTNKPLIEAELQKRPISGLYFIYYDLPQPFYFNENLMGEQIYYVIWQLFVRKNIKNLSKTIDFDLVHHLTFNQFRTPSVGFFLEKPFIMGPVGGAEYIHPVFVQDLTFKSKMKERWRNLGLEKWLLWVLSTLKKNKKLFIFSSKQCSLNLKKYIGQGNQCLTIPAIAIDENDFNQYTHEENLKNKRFTIIYAGTGKDWKGLKFFIQSIAQAFTSGDNVNIKLIGVRDSKEKDKVSNWIAEYGVSEYVQVINFMDRVDLIRELQTADLSVYPSFRDSGSMSVLEACALGCPVLCFETGGQDMFPSEILLKLSVSDESYKKNLQNFSTKLRWALENRSQIQDIGKNARAYALEHFTWRSKASQFSDLYKGIVEEEAFPVENNNAVPAL